MRPPADQTATVAEHFRAVSGKWGQRYERRPERMSDLDLQLRRQAALQFMLPLLTGARRFALLDVGCGAGNLLAAVRPGTARLCWVDLAPAMIAAAARRCPEAELHVGDAAALPFAQASLDVVTCLGVLEYVPEPLAALREIARVLHPHGRLIVSLPNRASLFRRASRAEIAAEETLLAGWRRLRGRGAATERQPSYRRAEWTVAEAHALLRSAGLEPVATRLHTYGLWGQIGRLRAARWVSRGLSQRFDKPSRVARAFACTMVVLAQPARESGA